MIRIKIIWWAFVKLARHEIMLCPINKLSNQIKFLPNFRLKMLGNLIIRKTSPFPFMEFWPNMSSCIWEKLSNISIHGNITNNIRKSKFSKSSLYLISSIGTMKILGNSLNLLIFLIISIIISSDNMVSIILVISWKWSNGYLTSNTKSSYSLGRIPIWNPTAKIYLMWRIEFLWRKKMKWIPYSYQCFTES